MSVSNREGFLAFTELTPIFLIAMKNLILSLFLGLRTCANWEADYTCSYPVCNSWLVYQGPFPAPCPLPLTNVRGTQPLSVFASPPSTTRISPSSCPQGNALGVRVNLMYSTPMCTKQTTRSSPTLRAEMPIVVTIDRPYWSSLVDPRQCDSVVLFAGGTGVTSTLGLLDDTVGMVVRRRGGERTRDVEFTWCLRSFGLINWFAPWHLAASSQSSAPVDFPGIEMYISIYVKCPFNIPPILNLEVVICSARHLGGFAGFISGLPSAPSTTSLPVPDKEKASPAADPSETARRGETDAVETDVIAPTTTSASASSIERLRLDLAEDPLAYPLPSPHFALDEDEEDSTTK